MAIEAVVFDLGGVLEIVDDARWPRQWAERWARELGLEPADWDARMAHYDLSGLSTGLVSEQAMMQAYQAGLELSDAQVAEMFADVWDRYCGRLDTDLMAYAERLRPSYRLAIMSNSSDGARREEEKRFGLSRLFDPIVYSHEVGLSKPDPRIYALACELVGTQPAGMVVVDDLPANVDAARACGLHAVLHKDTTSTVASLEALLRQG